MSEKLPRAWVKLMHIEEESVYGALSQTNRQSIKFGTVENLIKVKPKEEDDIAGLKSTTTGAIRGAYRF